MNLTSLDGGESTPNGFQKEKHTELYKKLDAKLTSIVDAEVSPRDPALKTHGITGFDDLFKGGTLGHGEYRATWGTRPQLLFALSIAPNKSAVEEILDIEGLSPNERIKKLQEKQVLSGLRIIDLGSGRHSYFAQAVRSFGATVYTVDIEHPFTEMHKFSDITHIEIDLRSPDAAAKILQASGGNFDLVTEAIVSALPSQSIAVGAPTKEDILAVARSNTKKGGYLLAEIVGTIDEAVLRKK